MRCVETRPYDGFFVYTVIARTSRAMTFIIYLMKQFAVYILSSAPYGTLYIGVTSNLAKRMWEHKNHVVPSFTEKYDVVRLVYFELHENAESAIRREKRLKKYKRD